MDVEVLLADSAREKARMKTRVLGTDAIERLIGDGAAIIKEGGVRGPQSRIRW